MSMRFIGGIERRIVYREQRYDGANKSVYTFAGVDLGQAVPGRVIIVGVQGFDAFDEPTSVTVAGAAATRRVRARINPTIDIWSLVDETNTTATIVVSQPGAGVTTGIVVWSGYGFQNPVPADVDGATISGASGSVTLTAPVDGAVVAFAGNNAALSSISLTGVDHDVEYVGGSSRRFVGGSLSHVPAGSKIIGVTGNFPRIVAAIWS